MIEIRFGLLLGLFCVLFPTFASGQSSDSCSVDGLANAERRLCYSKALQKLNLEVELTVKDFISQFRAGGTDRRDSPVAADEYRKAATAMMSAQQLWKKYREQHCQAVAHSYTTGSGAGTAYEACRFRVTQERLAELRNAFQ
jgi:uncharacterized protein YecT (DUF1311 family)